MTAMPLSLDLLNSFKQGYYDQAALGLTKREHFAGLAMQSVLNNFNSYEQGYFDSSDYKLTVKNAVGLADALLAELDKVGR